VLRPESKNALVIGLGTGTTSGQLAQFMNVTTIEIEPTIVEAAEYFGSINLDVLNNPNHKLVLADGRNWLLLTEEKFDIISQEPCDPWQPFSAYLYSKEFFELVKEHLSKDGLFVKWVPIYTMSIEDFKSIYRTFNSVFPYVVAFVNLKEGEPFPVKLTTSEIILVGSTQKIELENLVNNFDQLPPEAKSYLRVIWIRSASDLLNLVLFTSEEIEGYANNAPIVTDDNSILEFSTAKNALVGNPRVIIEDISKFMGAKR
jgi:spermidine synthase